MIARRAAAYLYRPFWYACCILGLVLAACSPRDGAAGLPGDADRGRQLVADYGCGSCHAIPGVPNADGRVGPALDHWAKRSLIAGKLRNRPAVLVAWLQDPTGLVPGTGMPDQGLSQEEAIDVATYLFSLDGDEDRWPPSDPLDRAWMTDADLEPE